MIGFIILVVWLFLGWLGTAGAWTYCKKEFGELDSTDNFTGWTVILFGPFNLWVCGMLFDDFKHGFKYWNA